MTASVSFPSALGVVRPQPGQTVRFPELRDPDWWAQHAPLGDTHIARQVGCSRETARVARNAMGITGPGRGRQRGIQTSAGQSDVKAAHPHRATTETQLLDRYRRETRPGGPAPTETLLVSRIHAAHDARGHDRFAYDDALLEIAVAAMLIHQHRQRLRETA